MRLLILTAVVVVVVFSLSGHKEARVMEWIADRSMYTIHGFIVFCGWWDYHIVILVEYC